MASPGKALIIVENLTVPIDRRVWKEALTLREAGYQVTVISPAVKGYDGASSASGTRTKRRKCREG